MILAFAISLLLPAVQAEDKTYRVEGIPDDLHYTTGKIYELKISASDYASITAVTITVTNGSLSETSDFVGEVVSSLVLGSTEEGWNIFWKAPSESFSLGEGNTVLSIVFTDDSEPSEVWASYEVVIRPPEVESHDGPNVPNWALSLAWLGVSATVLLTIFGSIILRRDRLT